MVVLHRRLIAVLSLAGAVALATPLVADARPAPAPNLVVQPSRAQIGKKATILGHHLRSSHYYILLVAVPNEARAGKHDRALLPLARTDASGNLTVTAKLPIITRCGPASIYAWDPQGKAMIRGSFTLTGCKASTGGVSSPPSPPKPKKHKP